MIRGTDRPNGAPVAALATACLVVMLVTAASGIQDRPSTQSFRIARMLDMLVQHRFQNTTAGKFGPDRMLDNYVQGHAELSSAMLSNETSAETRVLNTLYGQKRPIGIAILHLPHTPGSFTDTPEGVVASPVTKPEAEPLAVCDDTVARSDADYQWMDRNLDHFTVADAKLVRSGSTVITQTKHWILFVQPIMADQMSCLSCHRGAKKDEVLAGMIYLVGKDQRAHATTHFFTHGGV